MDCEADMRLKAGTTTTTATSTVAQEVQQAKQWNQQYLAIHLVVVCVLAEIGLGVFADLLLVAIVDLLHRLGAIQ